MNLEQLKSSVQTRTRRILELPEFRRAAVLVPVVLEPEPHLILTLRTKHLPTHKGQISFPGGSLHDLETPTTAALREAHGSGRATQPAFDSAASGVDIQL